MSGLIQNSHTSLLPIYSREISPGGTAIVYISTTSNVGQLITVRDMDGYLSSPQQILVSTTPGVVVNGATVPISIRQGFGYLTLRATSNSAWTTVDTSAFADPSADYTIRGVAYSSFVIQDLVVLSGSVSTSGGISTLRTTFSTMNVGGQLNTSTLGVQTVGGQRTTLQGPVAMASLFTTTAAPITVNGTFTGTDILSLSTNVSSLQDLITTGSATVGSLNIAGEVSTSYTVSLSQTLTVGGQAILGFARPTKVLTTTNLSTPAITTSRILVSSLNLSTAGSFVPRDDIPITDAAYTGSTNPTVQATLPLAAPILATNAAAAAYLETPQLAITTTISSAGAANFLFGGTAIQNSNGSATFSSVVTGAAAIGTLLAPGGAPIQRVGTGAITASSIRSQRQLFTNALIAPTTYTTLLTTNLITTNTLNTGLVQIEGNSLTISTLFVSSAISSPELSSIIAPVATILNTNGQITTSSLTASTTTASTLQAAQTITSATGLTFAFSTPFLTISTAQASTAQALTATTSSFRGTAIQLGSPLLYSTLGPTDPWTSTTTVSGLTSNTQYEYIQGIGTPYQPLRIRASVDRTVNLYLRNISSFSTAYFTANMTYRNDSSISGVAGLRIVNAGGTSTILSFSANPVVGFQKQVLSNYPVDIATGASTTTYWLNGPNTLSPPSTVAAYPQIVAGGTAPSYMALNSLGDTETWTSIGAPPFTTATYSLTWNGSNMWLAGGQGTSTFAYSYNGSNWYGFNTTLFTSVYTTAWNGTVWVAGGGGTNTLAYSYDGFNWTGLGTTLFNFNTNAVAWNGSMWLAAGGGTANSMGYSYDGLQWNGLGFNPFSTIGYGVTWSPKNNLWVATGGMSTTQLAYSRDGFSWTPANISTFVNTSSYGYCVAWNGSQFVAGGDSNIMYSADGQTWTKVGVSSIMSTVRTATWTGSTWCIGGTFVSHSLATSSNAATWTGITASTLFTTVYAVQSRVPIPIDLSGADLLVAGAKTLSYATTPANWTPTSLAVSTINSIAVGRDTVVAAVAPNPVDPSGNFLVTTTNQIRYSTDGGVNWTSTGVSYSGSGIAYSGSLWVLVGQNVPSAVYYSADGILWSNATVPTTSGSYNKVAYGNGRWIATGNADFKVITSTNGITWTTLTAAANITFGFNIVYGGGIWLLLAGGIGNPNSVQYSTDGLTWYRSATASQVFNNTASDAAWNGNRWVMTGNGTSYVMYSDDGIAWVTSPSGSGIIQASGGAGYSVATNGTTWVIAYLKSNISAAGIIYSTDNGVTWTDATSVNSLMFLITSVIWNGTYFIGVGQKSVYSNTIVRSTDGITWTGLGLIAGGDPQDVACRVPFPFVNGQTLLTSVNRGRTWRITDQGTIFAQGRAVAWNGYLWVAVGDANTDTIAYSYDGLVWTGATGTTLATSFRVVAWNGSTWFVYGTDTTPVAMSTDGINWTGYAAAIPRRWNTIACSADGTKVFAGESDGSSNPGYIYFSSDSGNTWILQQAPGLRLWNSIACSADGTKAVAVPFNDYIWTYSNGIWTEQTGSGQRGWLSVASSADGTKLAAGDTPPYSLGYIYTSTDSGATWTAQTASGLRVWYALTSSADGTKLAGAEVNGYIYTSTDSGVSWTQRTGAGARAWYAIACSSDGMKLVTANSAPGYIYTSTDGGATWTEQTSSGQTYWTGIASSADGTKLAAMDPSGYINTSTDSGSTWTPQTGSGLYIWYRIASSSDGTKLVAATINDYIYRSADSGVSWTQQNLLPVPTECATYNGSNLWVGGADVAVNGNTLLISADGILWTGQGTTPFTSIVRSIGYNGVNWTAVGDTGSSLATSPNGTTWTANATTLDEPAGVVWTGKTWVAVGTSTIATATANAATAMWSTVAVSSISTGTRIASAYPLPYGFADSNILFAGSSNASTRFAVSMNGTSWIPISSITAAINTVSWNGRSWFLGLGGSPALQILTTNFSLSTPTQTSFNLTLTNGFGWGPQFGLAVGQGTSQRHLAYTTDGGLTWNADRNNANPYFFFDTVANAVAFGGNRWVAVGQDSTLTQSRGIRFSENGINWSTPSTTAGRGILLGCAVAYHSSVWVVGGSTVAGTNDTLAVSANGSTWNYLSNTTFSVAARGIAWGSSNFVAVGEGTNTLAYSSDGSNWTGLGTSIFSTRGRAIAWNGRYFVALGEGTNTMAYSADGLSWTGLGTSTFSAMGNGGIAARSLLPTLETAATPVPYDIPAKTFIWSLTGITQLSQTSVQKPAAGGSAWNARAASSNAFTASVWLSFQAAQTNAEVMFGLSENPTATTSFTALNFAFYTTSSGSLRIYELGTQVAIIGSYQTTDTFRITYDGTTVRYYQNSTLVRSVARAVGAALYMSSSFFTPTAIIQSIDFHPLYTLAATKPALSTTGYTVSQTAGTQVDQFGPFYLTLTSNLLPSLWNFYITLNGTATSTNSLYADVFINEIKYFSTTVITPIYSTLSTYSLAFSNTTTVSISTPALLDVRFRATRNIGDTYLYTNWVDTSGIQQRSSAAIQNSYNPNAIEYLQFFHTSFNSGLQTSELDFYVGPTSTLSTYLNSNAGIDIYSGYLTWPTALNGITVENRYNDTTTRSLTYGGALYNASDPKLKEDIVLLDTTPYYETLASLPLRRYRFCDAYREQYRTEDTTQLGVLTTEVAQRLPQIVQDGPDGIQTIDRAQLRFAHMAATQELVHRISSLKGRIGEALNACLRHISTPQ